jgi:cellulose synthase operon protein C
MRRTGVGCLIAAASLAVAGQASAQAISGGPTSPLPAGGSLLDRTAVAKGRELLYGPFEEDRRRGVERLAASGTPQAVDALLEAFETGSVVARDLDARLLAVRLLHDHARRADVRKFLVRELAEGAARRDPALGVSALLRQSAALALARAGDPESLNALVTAAAQRGPAGEAARAALVAVPPVDLDRVLFEPPPEENEDEPPPGGEPEPFPGEEGRKPRPKKAPAAKSTAKEKPRKDPKAAQERTPRVLSQPLISLLGDLGDVRAIPPLRAEIGGSRPPSRAAAAAAVALAKLGDTGVATLVLPWLDESEPRVVAAAAEVLVILGHPKAPPAVAKALKDAVTRPMALELAGDLASPELAAPVAKLLPALEGEEAARAVMALARMGAAAEVAKLVEHETLGPAAISALGQSAAAASAQAIEAGLTDAKPARRRAFVRAAIIRALVLAEEVPGLETALASFAKSRDASDHETAAFGYVALGKTSAKEALGAKPSLAIVAGAARGALVRGEDELEAFVPIFAAIDAEKPSAIATAAGVVLLSREASDRVPFQKLLRLAENGGPLAPLAARALPRRDDGTARARVRALLEGTDPAVRAAVALGLGEATDPSSASVLAERYGLEEDEPARCAIVRALSARTEVQRERVLKMAAAIDPDGDVRRFAKVGLRDRRAGRDGQLERGLASMIRVETGGAAPPALRLVLPSGLALPVVPAPDGGLLLGGLPFGRSSLEASDAAEGSTR